MQTQTQTQNLGKRTDLIFSAKFDSLENYLLKVPKDFLDELEDTEELVIQADPTQHVILSSDRHSYRMKGVNLSTSLLVIDSQGTIHRESDGYVQLEIFQPQYHLIYQKMLQRSCKSLKIQQHFMGYEQLIDQYAFSEEQFRRQSQLNQTSFAKFIAAVAGLIQIPYERSTTNQQQKWYIYITLPLAVEYLRNIMSWMNQERISVFQAVKYEKLIGSVKGLSVQILDHLMRYFLGKIEQNQNQKQNQKQNKEFVITPHTICNYIIAELAVSKQQYTSIKFQEIVEEMLAKFMPAQIDTNTPEIQGYLEQARYQHFIQKQLSGGTMNGVGGGSVYVFYNCMELDTNLTTRLKFLAGFKKRYGQAELKSIFRGMDACDGGRVMPFADVLLKKFRKFGDQYEIKFIMPK